ncbi:MAG: TetR/AcrR family transcriptional regulator, partial [Calditrichia bacterium]|nr:TetR/AcrR family transcriptional regulator [Calditrichia bacterium]
MDNLSNRQNEIIETSIKLIAEKGIQQLTIKNISKKIGISEPAIYRHFNSKMDILLTILDMFKKKSNLVSGKPIENSTSILKLIELNFVNHFKLFNSNPALAAVIFSEEIFQNDKRLSDQVNLIMEINQKAISHIIREGQQNSEIRTDISEKQLSVIILGTLRLLITKWR